MTVIANPTGSLRVDLLLAEREKTRLLARLLVERFDRADGEWWPLLAPPAFWFDEVRTAPLLQALRAPEGRTLPLCDGIAIGALPDAPGFVTLELGVDLGPLLEQDAKTVEPPRGAVSMFRFRFERGAFERFVDGIESEWRELMGR